MLDAARWHSRDYTKQAVTLAGRSTAQRNLFFYGAAMPSPGYPTMPSAPAPNAETPLPIKTAIFTYTHLYLPMLPCSYADLLSYALP